MTKVVLAALVALSLTATLASAKTTCHLVCRDGAWGTGYCEWVCR
jgi:hypothetical protein